MAEPERILLAGATGFVGAATLKAFTAMGKIDKVTAMVRNADRAKEAVELGAKAVLVVPEVTELPFLPALAQFDCVLNAVNFDLNKTESYARETKLAEDLVAVLRARPQGGTYVQLTGTGVVGGTFARDGATAGEYTDWSELKPADRPGIYEPSLRHPGEKATVLADTSAKGGLLRTAVIRPSGIYGGDGRTDLTVRPYFREAEARGAPRVAGSGQQLQPLVHVDDCGDLLARVALTPTARGIFNAAEVSAEKVATSWTQAEIAAACSEAAGKGGAITYRSEKSGGKGDRRGQTLSCQNALSIGWKPRLFDAKVEYADYLRAKDSRAQRTGKKKSKL